MRQIFFRTLKAAMTIMAISGYMTAARAGLPSLSVDEIFDGNSLEFTINNPNPSPIGNIFGLMVAIPDQDLEASTLNFGWAANTLRDEDGFGGFLIDLGIEISEQFEQEVDLSNLFEDFNFTGNNGILAFFTLDRPSLTVFTPLTPGNSLGGFFGLGAQFQSSDIVLFGTGGNCTGQTNTQCLTNVTSIPEPGTLALFGIGVIGIGAAIRRRRRPAG